ncbi:MAG: hypothetical protein ACYDEP_12360 [Acidimicrobiales bacterium]
MSSSRSAAPLVHGLVRSFMGRFARSWAGSLVHGPVRSFMGRFAAGSFPETPISHAAADLRAGVETPTVRI